MAEIVVMPQLGNTVESCLITGWRVAVGQTVAADSVLCDIETDKSVMELPAGVAGTVLALLAEAGDEVPVRQPIALVGAPGEAVPDLPGLTDQAPAPAAGTPPAPAAPPTPVAPAAPAAIPVAAPPAPPAPSAPPAPPLAASPADSSPVSPRAKALATAHGLDATALTGSGPDGRVVERDVRQALSDRAAVPAVAPASSAGPSVAADLAGVGGLGLGGRLTRAERAEQARAAGPGAPPPADSTAFPGPCHEAPLSPVRRVIARRMMDSLATSAQLSYQASAPADALLALRRRLKLSDPALGLSQITVGDLTAFAAVRVLVQHPRLNAHLVDGVTRRFESVHLGIAVDTERGLLAPVLRFADRLGLKVFAAASRSLAVAARAGDIDPALLAGGSFTISNLGSFGVEAFTPILNPPQVAILGLGTIIPQVVAAEDGGLALEQRLQLSLTADHQVVDGADAGRFLRALSAALAQIECLILAG